MSLARNLRRRNAKRAAEHVETVLFGSLPAPTEEAKVMRGGLSDRFRTLMREYNEPSAIALLAYLRKSAEEWAEAPAELKARGSAVMMLLEDIDALREVEAEDRTKGS